MKRIIAYTLFLASIISCYKTEIERHESSDILYTTIEDIPDTKTYIDENKRIVWSEDDQIAVYTNSSSKLKYEVEDSSVGKSCGNFRRIDSENDMQDGDEKWTHNIAVYPYDIVTGCTQLSSYCFAELILPTTQKYSEGSFGKDTFPMVSIFQDNNLSFRNICGAIVLQLIGQDKITSIKFQGNNGEIVAGEAIITMISEDAAPSITMSGSESTSVILDCGNGIELNEDTPTSFIITLPPTSFKYGFSIVITNDEGEEHCISTDKENTIYRSTLLIMPAVIVEYNTDEPSPYDYIDEDGINYGPGILIDGVIFAPVNCGYKTPKGNDKGYPYGKLYQWGRKHGQGYSTDDDRDVPTIVSGPVSLVEILDEAYSNSFIKVTSSPHDWLSAPCEYLWNAGTEESPVKTEYDPCPEGWRVPTYAETYRLTQNRSAYQHKNNMFGFYVSGSVPYSKDVPQIYLEEIGYRECNSNASYRGSANGFWTSRVSKTNESYYFYSNNSYHGNSYYARARGYSVRCVKDSGKVIPISQIELSETSLTMYLNKTHELKSTLSPSDANHKFTHWSSSDNSIVHIDQNGVITSITPGTATITAVAGYCHAECVVTVLDKHEMIDYVDEYSVNHGQGVKIGLTVWAPVNCGYKSPTSESKGYPYGKLYQWGRKYGQGYTTEYDESQATMIEGPVSLEEGQSADNADVFFQHNSDWLDKANNKLWNSGNETFPEKTIYDPCPAGWRVPTETEITNLCQSYLEYNTDENNTPGCLYGLADGPDGSSIFLPLAGYVYGRGSITARNFYAQYWSSCKAYLRFTSSNSQILNWANRSDAFSVRCVQE